MVWWLFAVKSIVLTFTILNALGSSGVKSCGLTLIWFDAVVLRQDDLSKYGLSIWVRFRGCERLRELTAQQQSGGERAVSTALYLLALQSMSAVPFRCADEINQVTYVCCAF